MLEQLLKFFVTFFVVVEPVSLIPIFSGLTEGASRAYKHKMALKAVLVAGIILVIFAFGGAGFLKLMGISVEAFRIFGGMLLFLIALEMVYARESGTRTSSPNTRRAPGAPTFRCFRSPSPSWPGPAPSLPSSCGPARVTSHQPVSVHGAAVSRRSGAGDRAPPDVASEPMMRVLGVTGANVTNRLSASYSGRWPFSL